MITKRQILVLAPQDTVIHKSGRKATFIGPVEIYPDNPQFFSAPIEDEGPNTIDVYNGKEWFLDGVKIGDLSEFSEEVQGRAISTFRGFGGLKEGRPEDLLEMCYRYKVYKDYGLTTNSQISKKMVEVYGYPNRTERGIEK